MQEPDLEENALTARVADGRLRIESRSTDPGPPGDVVVTDPDGKTETVKLHADSPGRASATRAAAVPGVWQATQGTQSAYAAAGAANPPELADLRATATVAGPLARASDGGRPLAGRRRRAGAAPHRGRPRRLRQRLDRLAAAARSCGDGSGCAGPAAGVDFAAGDAGAADAGVAAGGALSGP